jgi:hypothetical protein
VTTSINALAARPVRFAPCHRIVASRLPTIHLFERVADPADWDALYELESMTNPRLRNEVGELHLVPKADRVSGPNASIVMAPFTHLSPQGTRFTNGRFGAYYAAESIDTSIAETRFHRENFLRATSQPPIELEMRCYLADVVCALHDLRGMRIELPGVYDPMSYAARRRSALNCARPAPTAWPSTACGARAVNAWRYSGRAWCRTCARVCICATRGTATPFPRCTRSAR